MYSDSVIQHFKNPKNMGKLKNPDGVGQVGNPVCVSPDTLVCANSQMTEIKELKRGNKVLGHDGKFHRIEKVFRRPYKGKTYLVTTHNLGKTLLTPEHHVLAVKLSHLRYKYKLYRNYQPDWYQASELKKGDFVLYPVISETRDKRYIDFDIGTPKWDFKSKALPARVKIDKNFLKLVGYYLSEGYVRTDKCKGTLGFTFASKEKPYIEEVINLVRRIFGINPAGLSTIHNATHIIFYSARLARFFERHFGKGASSKHLPHWAMLLGPQKQKYILCGLWRGDGYLNPKRRKAKFVTISDKLAYQTRDILLRQKMIFSFLVSPPRGIHKKHYSIYLREESSLIKLAKILDLRIKIKKIKNKKDNPHSWFKNSLYYASVAKIEPKNYRGHVFNLEVAEAHSYTSDSLVLHNCGDVMHIYIKVGKNKKGQEFIKDISFETMGCVAAIATSSMITELAKGKTLEEAQKITIGDVADALGSLPPIKMHCSQLAVEGITRAIENYRKKAN